MKIGKKKSDIYFIDYFCYYYSIRYSAGDILQWENSQLTVIGVGKHRMWLQKNSNGKN